MKSEEYDLQENETEEDNSQTILIEKIPNGQSSEHENLLKIFQELSPLPLEPSSLSDAKKKKTRKTGGLNTTPDISEKKEEELKKRTKDREHLSEKAKKEDNSLDEDNTKQFPDDSVQDAFTAMVFFRSLVQKNSDSSVKAALTELTQNVQGIIQNQKPLL